MRPYSFRAVKAVLATALAVAGTAAFAQQEPFPTLKGNNARVGRNANPNVSNPGQALLRWFVPYGRAETFPVELDNTDVLNTNGYANGPYDRLPINPALLTAPALLTGSPDGDFYNDQFKPFGNAAAFPVFRPQAATYNTNTEWMASPNTGQATGAITPLNWLYSSYDANPTAPQVTRSPDYVLTRCTAGSSTTDPTLAITPSRRRYFEWRVFGAGGRTARNYALYANLLVGPTTVQPGNPAVRLFPQRYYVFEIIFGGNQRVVDVVDTYAAGSGLVRLGGGGRATNATFAFDGVNPVIVRLYNVVPRDKDNNLMIDGDRTPINPSNAAQNTQDEVDEIDANRRLTYADYAEARPSAGRYDATPIMTGPVTTTDPFSQRVVAALNVAQTEATGLTPETNLRGVVSSYDYNLTGGFSPVNGIFNQLFPNRRWSYAPPANENEVDRDDQAADVTVGTGWTRQNDDAFLNGSYLQAPVVTDPANGSVTAYQPALSDGLYSIYVYLPGNTATTTFGKAIQYRVTEASNDPLAPAPIETTYTVDQSQNRGWVRLGTRRFRSRLPVSDLPTQALKVEVSNYSTAAGDAGSFAYADGVRFVSKANTAIRSTPVYATALVNGPGGLVERNVVIVADETGRIRCLDAAGRADGTTDVYWTYPTTPRANVTDPNVTEGIDGTTSTVAQMPSGFDLSTALIQRINGVDYLYVGSTNGRVYCIAMAGRGDFDIANRIPGTTQRVWSFPNDFPVTAQRSSLGPILGSVTYGLSNGRPTIFVPASAGRVYALDALPADTVLRNDRITQTWWVYPALDQPTIGTIRATPLYEFGSVYVGGSKGVFYRLNADSGLPQAQFPTAADRDTGDPEFQTFGFTAGPASATAALLTNGQADTVFAADDNGYAFGLRATDLRPIWSTYTGTSVRGSLGFTMLNTLGRRTNVTDPIQPFEDQPTVIMPTRNGEVLGLFARAARLTGLNNRQFFRFAGEGDAGTSVSSAATGGQYLFYGDANGFLYGLSSLDAGGAFDPGVIPPGDRDNSDDDPRNDLFRGAKLRFITAGAYQNLRLPLGASGHPTFAQTANPAQPRELLPGVARPSPASGGNAFEWGETVYAIVYNYPHLNRSQANSNRATPPPVVYFNFAVAGEAARSIPVASLQFENAANSPDNEADDTIPNDGYAVVAFTFQGGGPNAVPPGEATLTATLSTQALSASRTVENVALDPAQTTLSFVLANPLAVYMSPVGAQGIEPGKPGSDARLGMGASTDPTDAQNTVNGSPNVAGTAAREDRLLASGGVGNHAARNKARFWVADRSLMGLIRPDGLGLDNVRVNVAPLAWQGGAATIYKPFNTTLYPNFEDLPTQLPNVSVDYPDIRVDAIGVVKEPDGRAENPLFNSVSLTGGTILVGGKEVPLSEEAGVNLLTRNLSWSAVDVTLDVPRFQPPNRALVETTGTSLPATPTGAESADPRYRQPDSIGNTAVDQGYIGRFSVYVDSTQNSALDDAAREAFRAFSVATAVNIDEKLRVLTPQIDPTSNDGLVPLGGLAAGTGYTLNGGNVYEPTRDMFSPYYKKINASDPGSVYSDMFKPFSVLNEGNVNMLDIRLAKRDSLDGLRPWNMIGSAVDSLAWLDGSMDLWSNFDYVFAPRNRNAAGDIRQISQKSRVGDTVGTQMKVNPTPRLNPNIPANQQRSVSADVTPNQDPKVAVTVPIGFPVGSYASRLRVIENWYRVPALSNEILDRFGNNDETRTEPSLDITFNVRETRLTGRPTVRTDAQIDRDQNPAGNAPKTYQNLQPAAMRDPFGSLVVAWTSNRPTATDPGVPTAAVPEGQWRIFFAALDNAGNFGATGYNPPGTTGVSVIRQMSDATTSPQGNPGGNNLRDLGFWVPQGNSWFKKPNGYEQGYPVPGTNANLLFSTSVVADSARYGSPSFPSQGFNLPLNPYTPSPAFASGFMAFVGEARGTDGSQQSRVFIARIATNDAGDIQVSAPSAALGVPGDGLSRKGRPTVVQTGDNSAIVLFPSTAGNATTIQYASYNNGAWVGPLPLPFGDGFASVESIAATVRAYQSNPSTPLLEISFTGRLKGGSASDTYIGRLPIPNGALVLNAQGGLSDTAWLSPPVAGEPIANLGGGLYRTSGVDWDRGQTVTPLLQVAGGTPTALVVPTSRNYDAETGRISYDTVLGGRIVIDPGLGTLRLTGGSPGRNARVVLDYSPRFRRASDGTGGTSDAGVQFDRRPSSDVTYWRRASGATMDPTATNDLQSALLDRLVVTYTRGGGQGEAARPFMRTFRYGLELTSPIYTDAQGRVGTVTVSGLAGPYQVDPANGRIYVTSLDEGKTRIAVRYTGLSGTNTSVGKRDSGLSIRLLEESREVQIPIEQARNETGLTLMLDPFNAVTNDPVRRRPPLMWLFWTSTRSGAPDLYFESYAPRITPIPLSGG